MNATELLWKMLVDQREVFGKVIPYRNGGTIFWEVMSVGTSNSGKTIIRWTHYGSSANKCTHKDLAWILKEIFGMTSAEFLAEYMTFHNYAKIDKMYKGGMIV